MGRMRGKRLTYLLVLLLQFGSLGSIGSLVFLTCCSPQLAQLLGDLADGDAGVLLLDPGTVVRAEDEEGRAGGTRQRDALRSGKKHQTEIKSCSGSWAETYGGLLGALGSFFFLAPLAPLGGT